MDCVNLQYLAIVIVQIGTIYDDCEAISQLSHNMMIDGMEIVTCHTDAMMRKAKCITAAALCRMMFNSRQQCISSVRGETAQ